MMDLNNCENTQEVATKRKRTRLKENHPSCTENVSHYFCEFGDQTSMHGFNLLVERGRTIPERLYWIIVILVGIYFSIVLVNEAYHKWLEAPVVVTFATSETPIWEIPFPAVTICPAVKSYKSKVNYTDLYLKVEKNLETPEEKVQFEYMSLLCGSSEEFLNESQATTDKNAIKFLRDVAPDFAEMIFAIEWLGVEYSDANLTDLFSPILTAEGICYTFNIMDRSELFTDYITNYEEDYFSIKGRKSHWSLESGYSDTSDIFSSYPRRTLSAGIKGGLSIMFATSHEDIDYICGLDRLQGFKVILHHPAEIPLADQDYFLVPLDVAVVAAVKPKMMMTSDEIKNYKVEDRKCYFTNEKNLKFYKIYNQQNCLIECLTNFTLHMCGCVEFYMAKDNLTSICSAAKQLCIYNSTATFLKNEHEYNKNGPAVHNVEEEREQCRCLPSCTSLEFDIEYSQIDWEWVESLKIASETRQWDPSDNYLLQNDTAHLSQLVIFFKNMQFLTSERNELKGTLELFSDFGGLLGLFLGFSFISAFEVVYYVTLRCMCNIRLFGRYYWSGSEELLEAKENRSNDNELEGM